MVALGIQVLDQSRVGAPQGGLLASDSQCPQEQSLVPSQVFLFVVIRVNSIAIFQRWGLIQSVGLSRRYRTNTHLARRRFQLPAITLGSSWEVLPVLLKPLTMYRSPGSLAVTRIKAKARMIEGLLRRVTSSEVVAISRQFVL
jgi:hypothetical protein